jgi:hypothetical protein
MWTVGKRGVTSQLSVVGFLPLAALTLAFAGCGDQGTQKRMAQQLEEIKGNTFEVAKFSGKVTIDGQTPSVPPRSVLVLMLYSAKDVQPGHEIIYETVCDKEGHFEFTRFTKGDGVPPGSYTVLFGELTPRHGAQFIGPDRLGNRYNDPDTSPFHVEIKSPGKTDWEFNLEVAGKDPIPSAGPHAVTRILKR